MNTQFEVLHNRMDELEEVKEAQNLHLINRGKAPDTSIPNYHILYVEDSSFDSKWFHATIAKSELLDSFEIVHTKTLSKALKLLNRQAFDLVVTDLNLPDSKDGEIVRQIERQFPLVPTVVLTASDEPATAVDCIQHGARDYFVKHRTRGDDLARSMRFAMMSRS